MNMANTGNPDQLPSMLQQPHLYEPSSDIGVVPVPPPQQEEELLVPDELPEVDLGLEVMRVSNFPSDHLHHGYPNNHNRRFDDILHSQVVLSKVVTHGKFVSMHCYSFLLYHNFHRELGKGRQLEMTSTMKLSPFIHKKMQTF